MRKRCRRTAVATAAATLLVCLGHAGAALAGGAAAVAGPPTVSVVESVPSQNLWLSPQPSLTFAQAPPTAGLPVISVDDAVQYQVITGFGGAMTDSSAWLIEHELPAAARTALMSELFGSTGIHLNFLRVPIGASDYTVGGKPYSYDDLPAGKTDPTLRHFSIRHDEAYILPALKQVLALNTATELLASPWSPPAWMKKNDSLANVRNQGRLLAAYYPTWARYIVKFIEAYAAAGVPISAITPQNEPANPTQYPGLDLSTNSLATWTDSDLVPALRAAKLATKVYGLDFGWGSASLAVQLATGETSEFSGVAWHCYFGSPDVMDALHTVVPQIPQIVDECSPGITPIPTTEVVIGSLRNWASVVALWNVALDPAGGPVELPNTGCPGCYGLATIDEATHSVTLTSAFYELGQASIAIEPGAVRVASTSFVTYDYLKPGVNFISPSVDDVAVVNPDGTRAVIAYNNGLTPATFAVEWDNDSFDYTLPAGATVTFDWPGS